MPLIEHGKDYQLHRKEQKVVKGGIEKIMVVDDEEDLCLVVQEFLQDYGYKVTAFGNGVKAFEAFEQDLEYFDLIITDMTMPGGMTGMELSKKVLQLRQNMPIILCTGYSEILSKEDVLNLGIQRYVQKPLANNELSGKRRYRSRRGNRSKKPGVNPMRPKRKEAPIMVKVTGNPPIKAMVNTKKSHAAR